MITPPIGESTFAMSVKKSDGTWLNINDNVKYRVSADSLGQSSVSFRRTEVKSPYVEGSFLVHAVKDMVSENISVFVNGYSVDSEQSQDALRDNIQALIDAFTQNYFDLKYSFGNSEILWKCHSADYSVQQSREYIHKMTVPVRFSFSRYPTETRSEI
jgi:hypothetical protein